MWQAYYLGEQISNLLFFHLKSSEDQPLYVAGIFNLLEKLKKGSENLLQFP